MPPLAELIASGRNYGRHEARTIMASVGSDYMRCTAESDLTSHQSCAGQCRYHRSSERVTHNFRACLVEVDTDRDTQLSPRTGATANVAGCSQCSPSAIFNW